MGNCPGFADVLYIYIYVYVIDIAWFDICIREWEKSLYLENQTALANVASRKISI